MEISSTRNTGILTGAETYTRAGNEQRPGSFETIYARLREKEGRSYSDEELRLLPRVARNHPHRREWTLRARSMQRLIRYGLALPPAASLLEVGCGNGWLSAAIASQTGLDVTGLDPQGREISQARRVFGGQERLRFLQGEFFSLEDRENFNIILFAASLQYFPHLGEVLHHSFRLLKPGGEVHIMDTSFYPQAALAEAASRSASYFRRLNEPAMDSHYYHRSWEELSGYKPGILARPHAWKRWTGIRQNPFPWIRIYKPA